MGILATLSVIAISVFSFNFGKLSNPDEPQTTQVTDPVITQSDITNTPISKKDVKDAVFWAITENDFYVIEKYLNDPVSFRIENSGCCGMLSVNEALEQLKYLENAKGSWTFDQNSEIIKSLVSSRPEDYSNAIIGINEDLQSAAFQLDAQNKITKISLSASYDLLLQ